MIYTVKVKIDTCDRFVLDGINNEIEISVCSAPVKGKANKEIVKKISDYFKVKQDNVTIIRGTEFKNKDNGCIAKIELWFAALVCLFRHNKNTPEMMVMMTCLF